jgi:hypothetical protein
MEDVLLLVDGFEILDTKGILNESAERAAVYLIALLLQCFFCYHGFVLPEQNQVT